MSSVPDTYLVTGGAGFLGSDLVRALVARGERVRVLDNSFRGSRERLGQAIEEVEFVEADVRDAEAVSRAVEGCTVVCHLAAINGTKHFYEIPDQVIAVGLHGTINVLEACRKHGVQRYFFASSSEAYQTPPTVPTDENVALCFPNSTNPRYSYGVSKLAGEVLSFSYGRDSFHTVCFRPHNVYGPQMGFEHVIPEFVIRLRNSTRNLPKGTVVDFPIQGTGVETRAFCNVHDFTRGLLLCVDKAEDQSIYNIGTDEEVSIANLAERLAEQMGYGIVLRTTPLQKGGTPRRCPDITKLRKLGYVPRLPLQKGLAESIAWYSAWADQNA